MKKNRGRDSVTFERIFEDPDALRRGLRLALSLDYRYVSPNGDISTFGELVDPVSVIGPRPKTTLEEINEGDVQSLSARVLDEVARSWRKKYDKGRDGTELAVKVFDGLCDDESLSTIARRLRTTRQRVQQIRDQLVTLPAVKKLGKELRSMKSED